jgi:2-amino-4-hydroxy-6-hydroxymethyldihydropteridine diphosphokinase
MSELVYIGLGSNLGERQQHLSWAVNKLASYEKITVTKCSSVYETAAIGNFPAADKDQQPDFLNAVCQLETTLSTQELLDQLLAVEKQAGRVRTELRDEPRTLDLDLLLYGDQVINSDNLCVPHPRLHQRAFVLCPLLELSPKLSVPGKGPVKNLIKNVGDQEITKLPTKII